MNETKKCEICGRELPISEFSKSYKNRCRECVAKLTREKRAADKHSDAGCELIINPQTFDEKVWQSSKGCNLEYRAAKIYDKEIYEHDKL